MSESKHTEGKLVVKTPARAGSSYQLYSPEGNGHLVALLSPSNSDPENTAANADRLALTWNCHDDLLEALKESTDRLRDYEVVQKVRHMNPDANGNFHASLATIRKQIVANEVAIAAAEVSS